MTSGPSPIRVLVVDDSPAMQQLMKIVIDAEPELALAGIAGSAEEGWSLFIRSAPAVVALDLEMPGRPGIDLLRRIIREKPTPVVIVSANGGVGSAETIGALAAGAVAFIDKPDTVTTSFEEFRVRLVATLKECALSAGGLQRLAPRIEAPIPPVPPRGDISRDKVVAIGASTGGVVAIQKVMSALCQLPVPVLITQHMPAGYTARFAERLSQVTKFNAREAKDGDLLRPGLALIAPGGRHLSLVRKPEGLACRLIEGPPVSGHCPSVDVMFRSVAATCGARSVGVLLTGMGRDGAEGLLRMRKAGAPTIVESEETAVVWGMPKAALEMQGATHALALPMIGQWIMRALSPATQTPATQTPAAPMPAAPTPAAPRAPGGPSDMGKDLRSKPIAAFRALVVDDQKSMRGLAILSLKQLGFTRIDEAGSGEDALRAMEQHEYDLILLDWNMDGMSGIETLKAVRAKRGPRDLVVIMTTSESHIGKVHEATQAGANNYLIKPCAADKLKQRLERALMRTISPIAA